MHTKKKRSQMTNFQANLLLPTADMGPTRPWPHVFRRSDSVPALHQAAIGIRLEINATSFCFIGAHLAAHLCCIIVMHAPMH